MRQFTLSTIPRSLTRLHYRPNTPLSIYYNRNNRMNMQGSSKIVKTLSNTRHVRYMVNVKHSISPRDNYHSTTIRNESNHVLQTANQLKIDGLHPQYHHHQFHQLHLPLRQNGILAQHYSLKHNTLSPSFRSTNHMTCSGRFMTTQTPTAPSVTTTQEKTRNPGPLGAFAASFHNRSTTRLACSLGLAHPSSLTSTSTTPIAMTGVATSGPSPGSSTSSVIRTFATSTPTFSPPNDFHHNLNRSAPSSSSNFTPSSSSSFPSSGPGSNSSFGAGSTSSSSSSTSATASSSLDSLGGIWSKSRPPRFNLNFPSYSSQASAFRTLVNQYARRPITPMSLSKMIETGRAVSPLCTKTGLNEYHENQSQVERNQVELSSASTGTTSSTPASVQALLENAAFLCHELPSRLAARIRELERLPYGLGTNRHILAVKQLYVDSFRELVAYPVPTTEDEELAFTASLEVILERHGDIVPMLAKAVLETKDLILCAHQQGAQKNGVKNGDKNIVNTASTAPYCPYIDQFIDNFLLARIGIRMLIAQHCALHYPREGFCGVVQLECDPVRVIEDAVADAALLCERTYGEAPDVEIVFFAGEDWDKTHSVVEEKHVMGIHHSASHHLRSDSPGVKIDSSSKNLQSTSPEVDKDRLEIQLDGMPLSAQRATQTAAYRSTWFKKEAEATEATSRIGTIREALHKGKQRQMHVPSHTHVRTHGGIGSGGNTGGGSGPGSGTGTGSISTTTTQASSTTHRHGKLGILGNQTSQGIGRVSFSSYAHTNTTPFPPVDSSKEQTSEDGTAGTNGNAAFPTLTGPGSSIQIQHLANQLAALASKSLDHTHSNITDTQELPSTFHSDLTQKDQKGQEGHEGHEGVSKIPISGHDTSSFLTTSSFPDTLLNQNQAKENEAKKKHTVAYVPHHLHHIVFEIVKNSMRAVIERHHPEHANGPYSNPMALQSGRRPALPAVKIIVAAGPYDFSIKISDQGGGIPRENMEKIWTYLHTTASEGVQRQLVESSASLLNGTMHSADTASDMGSAGGSSSSTPPLAGFGYGLPVSRLFARYFGGDLQVVSLEGYGTDAFIWLNRLDADQLYHV